MITTQEEFENLLTRLQSSEDSEQKAAEAALEPLRENPVGLLQASTAALRNGALGDAARYTAACLFAQTLTDKSYGHWRELPAGVQAEAKATVLGLAGTERSGAVRRKMAACAVSLAGYLRRECGDEWPELLPAVFALSQSAAAVQRETALTMFGELALFLGAGVFRPYFGVITGILARGLEDAGGLGVRLASLTAAVAFLQIVEARDEGTLAGFRRLLPLMVGCVAAGVAAGEEDRAQTALQLLTELAETQTAFYRPCVAETVRAVLPLAQAGALAEGTRRAAMELLVTLCEVRAGAVRRIDGFAGAAVDTLLQWMCLVERDAGWADFAEPDRDTLAAYAQEALDRVCLALHGRTLVPALFGRINGMLASGDWRARYAALTAVTMATEGCNAVLRRHVGELVAAVGRACADADAMVRWAALNCLGQLCTDFAATLVRDHGAAVCATFVAGMRDAVARVAARAAVCITNFCQAPPAHVAPHARPLLEATRALLERGDSVRVQEAALTCLTSLVEVVGDAFAPYYATFVPVLKAIVARATDRAHRLLRGKAMEAFTFVGVAVPRAQFLPDALEVMRDMAATPVASDDPQIGYLEAAWARLAECLGADFVQFLPLVMPISLARAQVQTDVRIFSGADRPDDGWDVQYVGDTGVGVHTALLEEKASAIHILACYAAHVGAGFRPYVRPVADIVARECGFELNEGVRQAAFSVMPFLLACTKACVEQGTAAPADLHALWQFLFEPALKAFANERNAEDTLPQMLSSLAACLDILGAPSLAPEQLDALAEACTAHMNEWVAHQRDLDEQRAQADYDDEDEESTAELAALVDTVLGALQALSDSIAKSHRDAYAPAFQTHLVPVLRGMLAPPDSPALTHKALCTLCGGFEFSPAIAARNADEILPHFVRAARNTASVPLRQAGVYSLGVAAVSLGDAFAPQVPACLAVLREAITSPGAHDEDALVATDNAVSAVVKIAHAFAAHLDMADTMAFVVAALPLRADSIEGVLCHGLFCDLLERYPAETLGAAPTCPRAPQVLRIFAQIVDTTFVAATAAPRIAAILRNIFQNVPQSVLASAGNDTLQKLQAYSSSH